MPKKRKLKIRVKPKLRIKVKPKKKLIIKAKPKLSPAALTSLQKIFNFCAKRRFKLGLNKKYAGAVSTIDQLRKKGMIYSRFKHQQEYLFPTPKGRLWIEKIKRNPDSPNKKAYKAAKLDQIQKWRDEGKSSQEIADLSTGKLEKQIEKAKRLTQIQEWLDEGKSQQQMAELLEISQPAVGSIIRKNNLRTSYGISKTKTEQEARRLRAAGLNKAQIEKQLGLSSGAMSRIMARNSYLTFEDDADIFQLFKDGSSIKDLSKKYNISANQIEDIIRRISEQLNKAVFQNPLDIKKLKHYRDLLFANKMEEANRFVEDNRYDSEFMQFIKASKLFSNVAVKNWETMEGAIAEDDPNISEVLKDSWIETLKDEFNEEWGPDINLL